MTSYLLQERIVWAFLQSRHSVLVYAHALVLFGGGQMGLPDDVPSMTESRKPQGSVLGSFQNGTKGDRLLRSTFLIHTVEVVTNPSHRVAKKIGGESGSDTVVMVPSIGKALSTSYSHTFMPQTCMVPALLPLTWASLTQLVPPVPSDGQR